MIARTSALILLCLPCAAQSPVRFRETAAAAGIDFVLDNHPTPRKHLVETMPGGVAAFDYDNDGRIDLFFTNGASLPSLEKDAPRFYNRLYRNLGGMKFADVTRDAGLAGQGYSMGVAGVNRNRLYHNTGKGRFEDVTERSGIRSTGWSVAAGWFDYDNDGLLDLFVVNYVEWSPAYDRVCTDPSRQFRIYCHPPLLPRPRQCPLSQPRRRHFRGRLRAERHRPASWQRREPGLRRL